MKKSKLYILLGLSLALIGTSLLFYLVFPGRMIPTWNPSAVFNPGFPDHLPGKSVHILDQSGNEISRAARDVAIGDSVIKPDGKSYKISRVKGDIAHAEYQGQDKEYLAWVGYFNSNEILVSAAQQNKGPIAIYHTHTDESYVPSDGKEAIPFKGGILQVGQSLANKLEAEQSQVVWSNAAHDPHDNNAYNRSRRTAVQLMKKNPVAIFDVHRDGIPDPNYYNKNIKGQDVTQLRFVIGRQNPKMNANMDFAKRLMAYANKIHPNIVKEIYVGKGNYNQDLMSTALLIEAGTHTNSRESAEKGIAMLADAVPVVLGIDKRPDKPLTTPTAANRSTGGWSSLGWVLGITIIGALAFLLISSGSFKNAKARLSKFGGNEMSNFFGPLARRKKVPPQYIKEVKAPLEKDAIKDAHDEVTKD